MAKTQSRIAGLSVRGFKSICSEQYLDIRPLTILSGANSAGKSSFMQPLLLLKQTLDAPGDPGALLLDGPNVRFTRADQLLSRVSGGSCVDEFAVRLAMQDSQSLEMLFHREEGKGFDLHSMVFKSGDETLKIVPGMSHEEIVAVLPAPWKNMHKNISNNEQVQYRWTVRPERCFFAFEMISADDAKKRMRFGPYGVSPSQAFLPHIQNVIHLPGLRGNPRRTYPKTAGGPDFPGTFEPYVASVIAQWQSTGGKQQLRDLSSALEMMGLTWKVKADLVEDTQVELKVGRLPHSRRGGAHDLVNIADVGFGVSQSLPVIVALIAAKPGQLVYLEQPEIHLHPLAQRKLAVVLRDAVARGVVAVIETHSTLLLREVQTLIARGDLKKDDVALHWFERPQGGDGETNVIPAELDDNGSFGTWPVDFDEIDMASEDAYLDAVQARRASNGG